jgi:plasmid stability protein
MEDMQQISVSVPDEVAKLIKVMAAKSGQSESSLVSQLLTPAVYDEASRRFKGLNYLKHAEKLEAETEKPEP